MKVIETILVSIVILPLLLVMYMTRKEGEGIKDVVRKLMPKY